MVKGTQVIPLEISFQEGFGYIFISLLFFVKFNQITLEMDGLPSIVFGLVLRYIITQVIYSLSVDFGNVFNNVIAKRRDLYLSLFLLDKT